ncbi:MAG TPA: N-acetylmuramoyl-L-alanine amidase [Verrucomicrobiae bacterium]|nr:N-acetylmuramoyl-L-alanine amidase [Verrucomicrobiae bacterium]
MKTAAAVGLAILGFGNAALYGQPADHTQLLTVSAVRHWVTAESVRIAIEVSGEFEFRSDRLHSPDRIYFDIRNCRPDFDSRAFFTADVSSPLIHKIRVAAPSPNVTRIVLDLTSEVAITSTRLRNPNRLVVELRPSGKPPLPTDPTATQPPVPAVTQPAAAPAAQPATPLIAPTRPFVAPEPKKPVTRTANALPDLSPAPSVAAVRPGPNPLRTEPPRPDPPPVKPAAPPTTTSEVPPVPKPDRAAPTAASETPATGLAATADAKPARRTSAGVASLTRALGLKLNRVVIDPGHGGHDQGTAGPHGLLEKELVLDVSLRLGKLIEQEMGAEVLYTRTDDTFVSLERRTQFANEKRADLFISVHANSSAYPAISGVETYVLNFTDNRSALDVAMRENATAQKPISDLRNIVEDISAHDKAQESREFASKIQASLFGFESRSFPGELNRGVKQAPFVVLIGTSMPAILTEIGFVTNSREESLLQKPDYRQKLAESIFRGVVKYNESLSHFSIAQAPTGN